jgi:hypothetical protein
MKNADVGGSSRSLATKLLRFCSPSFDFLRSVALNGSASYSSEDWAIERYLGRGAHAGNSTDPTRSRPISSNDAMAWGIRLMPTPNCWIAGAYSNTSMPCLFRKSAVVNPPIPAPTMIALMLIRNVREADSCAGDPTAGTRNVLRALLDRSSNRFG